MLPFSCSYRDRQKILRNLKPIYDLAIIGGGINGAGIARDAGMRDEVVGDYLAGKRKLNLDEFGRICRAMDADPVLLLLPSYRSSQLVYRQGNPNARRTISRIENVFQLLREELPRDAKRPGIHLPGTVDDPAMLLAELSPLVEDLRAHHGDTKSLYEDYNLPVLGVRMEDAFDACLMVCKPNYLVCINLDKPDSRIEFSLLHEFAHFVFDADRKILPDIEITGSDLYGDHIRPEARPEYIANKFAQLWLVPYEDAEAMAKRWPNTRDCADYIDRRHVSPDVVVNALHDVLRFRRTPPSYLEIKQAMERETGEWHGRSEIRGFVQDSTQNLYKYLMPALEDFGEERRNEVMSAWGFANGG